MSWTSSGGDGNDRPRDPYATPSSEPDRPPAYGEQSSPPPYDGSDQPPTWPGEAPQPQFGRPAAPSQPPKPIRTAVTLMYVGAAIAVLNLISVIIFSDEIRDEAISSALDSGLTQADAESMADFAIAGTYGAYIVAIALWLWMAYANRRGKLWARVLATVLGGLFIVFTLLSLVSGGTGLSLLLSLVTLALAGYILYLLYRQESTDYYRASSRKF